ncbi:MAG: histidine triad nucleotide-binding protein [Zetaproteobacteria bacterium CG1_02_53_45]|nr:MAG: histidine triad nucleotide-binding protein [Zetaproteobacteria bacterium CG1_02_53_45]
MSDCLFCKIAAGEIPCNKVYEDEDFLAFHDIHPKAPTHVLVIPKFHLETLADATEQDTALLGLMLDRVRHIADAELHLDAGYRVVINVREGGGQEVFHIHVHILGGKKLPF